MYVPADEAERELGEINMTFEGDTLRRVEHQGADPSVASAVNPLFNQLVCTSILNPSYCLVRKV